MQLQSAGAASPANICTRSRVRVRPLLLIAPLELDHIMTIVATKTTLTWVPSAVYEQRERSAGPVGSCCSHTVYLVYDSLHWNSDTNHCTSVVYHPPTIVYSCNRHFLIVFSPYTVINLKFINGRRCCNRHFLIVNFPRIL